jgi:hypothetical protein
MCSFDVATIKRAMDALPETDKPTPFLLCGACQYRAPCYFFNFFDFPKAFPPSNMRCPKCGSDNTGVDGDGHEHPPLGH